MFVEELADQLGEANRHLLALERDPANGDELRSLFRVMHTLKGAARSANVPEVERVCHRLEAMLASARDAGRAVTQEELASLFEGVDRLTAAGSELGGATMPTRATSEPQSEGGQSAVEGDAPPDAPRDASVRVGQERVDTLFAISNRLLILAGQTDRQPEVAEEIHDAVARGGSAWKRLRRELLARVDKTSVDLERDLGALDDSFGLLRKSSVTLLGDSLRTSRDLGRVSNEISLGVRELRMRPFADAVADLPRVVRDVAASTGKSVRLQIEGEDVQADRAVLAQLHDALLHLVRNAVDHGIEPVAVRRGRGKPEEGTISIRAGLVGDRIVVTVSDDGGGLDVEAMRRRLIERGEQVSIDERAIARRLFLGGVSTRDSATAISGRGVGLDAVRAAAERVRGSVDVDWRRGGGTTFTIEAPLTLATVRVILARVGKTIVALPSAFIDRLIRTTPEALRIVEGRFAVETGDGTAPAFVASIASVLGPPLVDRPVDGAVQLALVRVGERRAALRVDELLEDVEVVVRPIRAHGRVAVPHVSGAALLSSGTVALVLNVTSVTATALGLTNDRATMPAKSDAGPRRRVLVVDDSITTRTLESSVLEAAGYDVMTAVDGADGWRVLQERGADLVVSDVEMPRMDGLQLTEAMRASTRFRETPVILVTALETVEHRARGLEVGADAYLGKSSFEQHSLLNTVRELLG
jgi:two-component system chemotaxis sensor kinase CheA